MLTIWSIGILALTVIYVWATVMFGARFSNLTHRGIITSGPYRFTKHPAYAAKNIAWWMIALPFMTDVPMGAMIQNCLMLLGINLIYLLARRRNGCWAAIRSMSIMRDGSTRTACSACCATCQW